MHQKRVIVKGFHEAFDGYFSNICKESSELELETCPYEIEDIDDFVNELEQCRPDWLIIKVSGRDRRGSFDRKQEIERLADLRDQKMKSRGFRILAIADFPPKQNWLFHEDCKKSGADKFLYTYDLNADVLAQFLTDRETRAQVELNILEVFPIHRVLAVGDDTHRFFVPKIDSRHMQALLFLIVGKMAMENNWLESDTKSYNDKTYKITRVQRDPLWRALGSAFYRNVGKGELTDVVAQLASLSKQAKTQEYEHNIEETISAVRGRVKHASYLFETNEIITRIGDAYRLVDTITANRIKINLTASLDDIISSSWSLSDKAKA